jgi:tetratricopeptide (TPR) repeat protein
VYEYVLENLNSLGAKELRLESLSEEDIGEWIKSVKGINLPLVPDLKRIRENSVGFPLVLNEWIQKSKDLRYDKISRKNICACIKERKYGLNDSDIIKLYKMSILVQPLNDEKLANFLDTDVDSLRPFMERLLEKGIFEENYNWFKNDMVRRCFEDDLSSQEELRYHTKAAKLYLRIFEQSKNGNDNDEIYRIRRSCAYHLHKARMNEESYNYNVSVAQFACEHGDLDLAERSYKRAIDNAKILGWIDCNMKCILEITNNIYYVWGKYDTAYDNYQNVSKYFDNVKDYKHYAIALQHRADILRIKGEYNESLKLCNQSLSISKELGDQFGTARTLHQIAMIYYSKGEYNESLKLCNQSLSISKELGDKVGIAGTLQLVANIYYNKLEYDTALELYNQSLSISKELGDKATVSGILHTLATILHIKGEYDTALELYNQSLSISKELGDKVGIARILYQLANIFQNKDEYHKALKMYNQSLSISKELGDKVGIAAIEEQISKQGIGYAPQSNNQIICLKCNKKNYRDSKFCTYCGYALQSRKIVNGKSNNQIICLKCNKKNYRDSKFCTYCGYALQSRKIGFSR